VAVKRFVYTGLVVVVLAIIGLFYLFLRDDLGKARKNYEVEKANYEELKPDLEALKGVNGQIARFQSYSSLLAKLTENEPLWPDIYENLATLVSDNMYVETVKINRVGQRAAGRRGRRGRGAGPGVESSAKWEAVIDGYAYGDSQVALQERITRFVDRLKESPFFEEVYLQASRETVERVKGEPLLAATKGAAKGEQLFTEALTTIYSDVVPGTFKLKFKVVCELEGQQFWDKVRTKG